MAVFCEPDVLLDRVPFPIAVFVLTAPAPRPTLTLLTLSVDPSKVKAEDWLMTLADDA
jgi:hypothetical protein